MATITNKIRGVTTKIKAGMADGLEIVGDKFVSTMQKRLSVPFPPASKEGDYPARRSGILLNAAYARVNRSKASLNFGIDGRKAPYWRFLEEGTKNMAPRPSIRPTINEIKPQIPKIIGTAIRKRMKK